MAAVETGTVLASAPSRPPTTREQVLTLLRHDADAIRRLGATALYLYGSAARDRLGPDSDVDVFIDFDPDGPFSFVELIRLEQYIKTLVQRDVDLTTRRGLHPLLRDGIEKSCVQVF